MPEAGEIGTRCPECLRLFEIYMLAIRKVGQLEDLLHSVPEPPDAENIREELQKAEEIRIAARDAKLNHQATHGGR